MKGAIFVECVMSHKWFRCAAYATMILASSLMTCLEVRGVEKSQLLEPRYYEADVDPEGFKRVGTLCKAAQVKLIVDNLFVFQFWFKPAKLSYSQLKAALNDSSDRNSLCVTVCDGDYQNPPSKAWIDTLKKLLSDLGYRRVLIVKVLAKENKLSPGYNVLSDRLLY